MRKGIKGVSVAAPRGLVWGETLEAEQVGGQRGDAEIRVDSMVKGMCWR